MTTFSNFLHHFYSVPNTTVLFTSTCNEYIQLITLFVTYNLDVGLQLGLFLYLRFDLGLELALNMVTFSFTVG